MYSILLTAALVTTTTDTPGFGRGGRGHGGCCGCYGGGNCYGCYGYSYGCTGYGGRSSHGRYGCTGYASSYCGCTGFVPNYQPVYRGCYGGGYGMPRMGAPMQPGAPSGAVPMPNPNPAVHPETKTPITPPAQGGAQPDKGAVNPKKP